MIIHAVIFTALMVGGLMLGACSPKAPGFFAWVGWFGGAYLYVQIAPLL